MSRASADQFDEQAKKEFAIAAARAEWEERQAEPERTPGDGSETLVIPAGKQLVRLEFDDDGAYIAVVLDNTSGKWSAVDGKGTFAEKHDSAQAALDWLAKEGGNGS